MDGGASRQRDPGSASWAEIPRWGLPEDRGLRAQIADGSDKRRSEGYDILRTRMMAATAARDWSTIGVTQARAGKAAPLTALNLALSEARLLSRRVVLVDLDIERQPVLVALGIARSRDAVPQVAALPEWALSDRLAVMGVTAPADQAATLLLDPAFQARLHARLAALSPDITLLHLPPMLTGDAGLAGVGWAQAVLLTINGRADTAAGLRDCEARIGDACPILGLFHYDAEV
ncbi:MAG: CpsD/CapB family tyrosine-protein kinase [Alphaproteobacteria bacterium]|nr:CpsD/CapB family tyrosine-protein kinase [Alphaproteobacteria bacterium]